MKKITFLFAFIFAAFILHGQELVNTSINKVDEQGRKQGSWKHFDVNGKLKFEGSFVDDEPVGTFTYYYDNGKVKAISEMHEGGRRSETRIFHRNGRLMAEGRYLDEKKDSIWLYYSDYDGVLLSRENYSNGRLDGMVINYYPSGKVAEEIPYRDGLRHGEWKRYFTDGRLKLKASYVDDKLEGLMQVYHQSGFPEVAGTYKHNLKDGMWMYYNEEGYLLKKERYIRGNLKETIIPGEE